MGEIKIFGYILIAVVFLTAIVMPLFEMFFIYRERLMLSDALYNSCRVATEAGYNYSDIRKIDAIWHDEYFLEAFAKTFATSFGLDLLDTAPTGAGYILRFRPNPSNEIYNDFVVTLTIKQEYDTIDKKTTAEVTAEATSPYRFKHSYMRLISESNDKLNYELASRREYVMTVDN